MADSAPSPEPPAWQPPKMYAYIDQLTGDTTLVDENGVPIPSPPGFHRIVNGGVEVKDPWGNTIPLYEPPTTGVYVHTTADGTPQVVDSDGNPVPSPPPVWRDGNDPTWRILGQQISLPSYQPPTRDVYVHVAADGTPQVVDADGNPVPSPPTVWRDGNDPTWRVKGQQISLATYEPPTTGIYVHVGADGTPQVVDVNGDLVPSPPIIWRDGSDPTWRIKGQTDTLRTYEPPTTGIYVHQDASGFYQVVDANGNLVTSPPAVYRDALSGEFTLGGPGGAPMSLYEPPTTGIYIHVGADGTPQVVDAEGKLVPSPPAIVREHETGEYRIAGAGADGPAIPTYWPPSGEQPEGWPPAQPDADAGTDTDTDAAAESPGEPEGTDGGAADPSAPTGQREGTDGGAADPSAPTGQREGTEQEADEPEPPADEATEASVADTDEPDAPADEATAASVADSDEPEQPADEATAARVADSDEPDRAATGVGDDGRRAPGIDDEPAAAAEMPPPEEGDPLRDIDEASATPIPLPIPPEPPTDEPMGAVDTDIDEASATPIPLPIPPEPPTDEPPVGAAEPNIDEASATPITLPSPPEPPVATEPPGGVTAGIDEASATPIPLPIPPEPPVATEPPGGVTAGIDEVAATPLPLPTPPEPPVATEPPGGVTAGIDEASATPLPLPTPPEPPVATEPPGGVTAGIDEASATPIPLPTPPEPPVATEPPGGVTAGIDEASATPPPLPIPPEPPTDEPMPTVETDIAERSATPVPPPIPPEPMDDFEPDFAEETFEPGDGFDQHEVPIEGDDFEEIEVE